jgi:hypothetical protein
VKPTTKAKQRDYVAGLIHAMEMGLMTRPELIQRLRILLLQLRNRPPVKKGTPIAQPVTASVRRQVEAMYRADPSITNQAIADALNLNGGRVSEILAGKRL